MRFRLFLFFVRNADFSLIFCAGVIGCDDFLVCPKEKTISPLGAEAIQGEMKKEHTCTEEDSERPFSSGRIEIEVLHATPLLFSF